MFLPFRRDMLDVQPEEVFAWMQAQQPQHDGRCYVRVSALRAKFGNGARAFFAILSELAACGFVEIERWRFEKHHPGTHRHGAAPGKKNSGQWLPTETMYVFTPIDPALRIELETFVPKSGTFPSLRPAARKALWEQDGRRCVYCKAEVTLEAYQVDHKIPKGRGGTHEWRNLATACKICNSAKRDRIDGQWGAQE